MQDKGSDGPDAEMLHIKKYFYFRKKYFEYVSRKKRIFMEQCIFEYEVL